VSLDTNLLVYAEGSDGTSKQTVALHVLRLLPRRTTIVPVQVLGELFNVLVRKRQYSRADARRTILTWHDAFTTTGTSVDTLISAADLATIHQLSLWDAIVLTVAAESGCRLLLTEDLQEGFTWNGVTVVNPFAPTWHPLLEVALGASGPPADGTIVEE
jgi:predicted nucleic acid-binding protein